MQTILQAASGIATICADAVLLDTSAMRVRALVAVAAAVWVAAPSAAWAGVAHTVAPGESLWSVAHTDGLSVAQLAAANHRLSTSRLVAGSTLMIPPQERAAADRKRGPVTGGNGANRGAPTGAGGTNVTALVEVNIGSIQANIGSRSQYNTAEGSAAEAIGTNAANPRGSDGDTGAAPIHANVGASGSSDTRHGLTLRAKADSGGAPTASAGGASMGTPALRLLWSGLGELADLPHTVAPGESLWSIAHTTSLSVAELAAANGLSSSARLVAGSTLIIPPRERPGGGTTVRF